MKRPVSKSVWKRCQAHICPGTVRARNSFGCEMRVECQWTAGLASGLAWEMWSHLHFTFLEEEGKGFWPGFCWWHQRPFSTTSWTMVKPTEKWNIFLFPNKLKQFQAQNSGTFHNKRSSFSFCQGWSKSSPGFVWWFTPSSCVPSGASSVVFGEDLIQALQRSTVSRDAEVPRSDGKNPRLGGGLGEKRWLFWKATDKTKAIPKRCFGVP